MSTHKNIDRVCIVITILAVLFTVLFMNGTKIGLTSDDSVKMSYENTLFDDSYVHSIDIEIDDWDAFLETATNEEYTAVNVTIDGEKLKNVALRAKGNTSLSTVEQLGSSRYSLKLEFDRYQSSTTYHGLDKLCLNNLIQDYTMMKDYLAYKLMNEYCVASPLVSYTYVTINGEDWGLFLAVEAVEDSFLTRNYGTNHGNLYKPDSMSMGGGRGNGGGFDMRDMDFDKMGMKNPFEDNGESEDESDSDNEETSYKSDVSKSKRKSSNESSSMNTGNSGTVHKSEKEGNSKNTSDSENNADFPGGEFSGFGGGFGGFGMGSDDVKLKYIDDDTDSYSSIFESAKTDVSPSDKTRLITSLKNLSEGLADSDDDKIAEAVDIDAQLRYMVVHNFVVNGDSYTGSMIHNYYLYEEDGFLSMIPWDYNLAYGTFQSGDASGAVNDPIDNPLSITEGDTDRPMFSWIISSEKYTRLYHEYYEKFLEQFYESGYLTDLIDSTYSMIHSYVEKDPTKFCEVSEFEKAVETMKEFVSLRFESVEGQLSGTIGSTDAAQSADSDTLIDASSITLSDMGSMGGGGSPGGGSGFPGFPGGGSGFSGGDSGFSGVDSGFPGGDSGFPGGPGGNDTGFPGGGTDGNDSGFPKGGNSTSPTLTAESEASDTKRNMPSDMNFPEFADESSNDTTRDSLPGDMNFPGFPGVSSDNDTQSNFPGSMNFDSFPQDAQSSFSLTSLLYLGGYILALIAAIIFAKLYKNRQ